MKKTLGIFLALCFILSLPAVAYADQVAYWTSTTLVHRFITEQAFTKPSNYAWDPFAQIWVTSISSSGATRINCTPVNGSGQTIGATVSFTGIDDKNTRITSQTSNTIKLLIENNNGGINIASQGNWACPMWQVGP